MPIVNADGSNQLSILPGATVTVYMDGSLTVLFNQTMYNDNLAGNILTNPLTADANGIVEAWAPNPQTVSLKAVSPNHTTQTIEANFEAFSGG